MAFSRSDHFSRLVSRSADARLRILAAAALSPGLIIAAAAMAGGLSIPTYCVQCQGSGNAGAAARADSPATVFANPAGVSRLSGTRAELGLHAAWLNAHLSNGVGSGPIGTPVTGAADTGGGALVWPLDLYVTHQGSGPWSLGLGISTPFGLTTDYERGWVGRYHALRSRLETLDIGPVVSYRVTPWLSVGGGVDLVYASAELTQAVDLGSMVTAQLGRPMPALGITPGNPSADGQSRLVGDDWGLGWTLGLLIEPDTGTRIGLSYRSEVDLDLEGHATTLVPDRISVLSAGAIASSDRDASARLTLPATLRLGLWQAVGSRWRLMLGAQWTGWSSFEELRVRFADSGPDLVDPHDWNDVWRYSLGLEYRWSDRLTLRTGLEYDESPIPKVGRSLRVLGGDQRWLSLGLSFRSSPAVTWDIAYSHVLVSDSRVDLSEATTPWASGGQLSGNRLTADLSSSADILGLGLRITY